MSVPRRLAGALAVGLALVACSTPSDAGIEAPASQARGFIDQTGPGFRDAFRAAPGPRGVETYADQLRSNDSGSLQVRVLSTQATPRHGEIGMAVYSVADGARDGDPFGHWTVRMCVTLVADGSTEVQVQIQSLRCPDITDPPFADIDATVDY